MNLLEEKHHEKRCVFVVWYSMYIWNSMLELFLKIHWLRNNILFCQRKWYNIDGGVPNWNWLQDIQFWGTVATVLIVGGTIAEDVITGGGGIADDAASFYLAYRLMFGL